MSASVNWIKTIVAFYVLVLVLLFCSGCVGPVVTRSEQRTDLPQFRVIAYETALGRHVPYITVLKHVRTKRCFLFAEGPEGAGAIIEVTPPFRMYAIDGKPTSNEEDLCAEGVEK